MTVKLNTFWLYMTVKVQYLGLLSVGGEFYYWGTHGGTEVNFIWVRGKRAVGFEVKSSQRWMPEYSKDSRPTGHGRS